MRAGAQLAFVYTTPETASVKMLDSQDLVAYPGFSFLSDDCSALNKFHAIVGGTGTRRGQDATAIVGKEVHVVCL